MSKILQVFAAPWRLCTLYKVPGGNLQEGQLDFFTWNWSWPIVSGQIYRLYRRIYSRLLHPQHLDGIWIGQNQYRLPLAPLTEYPEPWCWKVADGYLRALASLGAWKKQSSRHGGEMVWKKTWVLEFLDSVFFPDHISPMSGTLFFSEHLNW